MHSTTLPPSLCLITLKLVQPFKFVLNRQCCYRSLLKLKSGWIRYAAASVSFFTLSAKHVLLLFAHSRFASFLLWPKPTPSLTSRNNLCKALATSTLVFNKQELVTVVSRFYKQYFITFVRIIQCFLQIVTAVQSKCNCLVRLSLTIGHTTLIAKGSPL